MEFAKSNMPDFRTYQSIRTVLQMELFLQKQQKLNLSPNEISIKIKQQ